MNKEYRKAVEKLIITLLCKGLEKSVTITGVKLEKHKSPNEESMLYLAIGMDVLGIPFKCEPDIFYEDTFLEEVVSKNYVSMVYAMIQRTAYNETVKSIKFYGLISNE